MASSESTRPAARLAELLRERQEPFVLDLYLLERRYGLNSTTDSVMDDDHHHLKTSSASASSSCLNLEYTKRRWRLRLVINKIMNYRSKTTRRRIYLSDCNCKPQTAFQSSTQDLKLQGDRESEGGRASVNTHEWGSMEDCSNQLSPVSVLELVQFDDISPFLDLDEAVLLQQQFLTRRRNRSLKKITDRVNGNHCLSPPARPNLPEESPTENQRCCVGRVEEPQNTISPASRSSLSLRAERLSRQMKQLFVDAAVTVSRSSHGKQDSYEVAGDDDLKRKVVHNQQIRSWRKKSRNVKVMNQLISSDFCNPLQKWNDFSLLNKYIGIEIEEAIFDVMVSETIFLALKP